jgi:hypothetical protein
MIGGQRLDALDRMHNHLRHGSVVVVPSWMVVFADCIRQFWVWLARPVELPLEDDQNSIAVAGSVFQRACFIRHPHEPLPEPMRLQIELDIRAPARTACRHEVLAF